jgi:protein SCO1/2
MSWRVLVFACLALVSGIGRAEAHSAEDPFLGEVGLDQRLGEQVPPDLTFRDERGRSVRLGDYFGRRPVILVLAYYNCTMLCPLVLEGLTRTLRAISFDAGAQFDVLAVSIHPGETPTLAATRKAHYLERYRRPGAEGGWHFLTGEETAIRALARAVGFRYGYDAAKGQFAHAAGVLLLTPEGRAARYLYGVEFSPRDLRLALVEAGGGRIGSPMDQLLLFCYRYDPRTGRYGMLIMNVLRLAGLATVLGLGTFMLVNLRREKRARVRTGEAG